MDDVADDTADQEISMDIPGVTWMTCMEMAPENGGNEAISEAVFCNLLVG